MSNKLYFRLLTLFVAVLGIAQMGWGLYFITPARQDVKSKAKHLAIPVFSSPTYKYRYREPSQDGLNAVWREVEIPEEAGRQILKLLRGSKRVTLLLDEYYRQNPAQQRRFRHFHYDSVGTLDVHEDGRDLPSLSVDFQRSREFIVTRAGSDSDFFLTPPEREVEIDNLTAGIQWESIQRDQ